ncbi:MF4B1-like protein [Mya arenaria]|uniref:MF4B1-like protein n=2 Tax=Mya arenaria TaxID=6604 RepID=A0ABY7DD13_MYAAR|nr:MF4B1-like protein [Mya arenaria]
MSRLFVFLFITGGLGLVAAVTPWCSNFAAMFIAHVLHGAFASALDTAATTDVTVIWRNKAGSYMQAVHGVFSVGAILSPFATQPFLAKRLPVNVTGPMTSLDVRMVSDVQMTSFIDGKGTNYSVFGETTMNSTPNLNDSSFIVSSAEEDDVLKDLYGETRIYVTYFASTALCMVVASCYIIVTLVYGNIYKRPVNRNDGLMKIKDREYFLSKRLKNIFTVMLAITLALYVMSERSVTNFLMTFVITKLHWSKAQGSYASSTFWITFAAGRLSGIFVVRYLKTTSVILIYFTSLTCAGASFWIAVVYGVDVLTWISIAVIGYGMSGIFASMFSWLSENVRRLTGKIASILFIFLSIGASLYPILVGYLMDHVSIMWFVYLQVMIFITITVCFIFIATFYNVLAKRYFKTGAIKV